MANDNGSKKDRKEITPGYRSVIYTVNKEGAYIRDSREGWEPETIALGLAWESINEKIENTQKRVISGELSPLAWFMEKNQFSITRLSDMTGIPKRKIRKHLHPEAFAKINPETAGKYTKAFQITTEIFLKPF